MPLQTSIILSPFSWGIALIAAFILGVNKSGLKGMDIIIVTIMALAFGAKTSTGILVPLLVVGDLFAVVYYNRHAQWKYVFRFLPWMLLGVLFGVYVGHSISVTTFRIIMSVVILVSVFLMFWWEYRKSQSVPTHWTFAGFIGSTAGFSTMVGNLAGAFSNLYFLAMRVPKNQFIGTAAWLFLIVNLFKLPFHIFVWETINWDTLAIDLKLLPVVAIGLFIGVRLVKVIKEPFFRKMILILTAIGACMILFS